MKNNKFNCTFCRTLTPHTIKELKQEEKDDRPILNFTYICEICLIEEITIKKPKWEFLFL